MDIFMTGFNMVVTLGALFLGVWVVVRILRKLLS